MENKDLEKYSLRQTEGTKKLSEAVEEQVYEIAGFKKTLLSTWDFDKNRSLPPGIWSVSTARDGGVYQLFINQALLEKDKNSAVWVGNMLELQIYLRDEE